MAKQKTQTPQDLYKQRKQREENEKNAYLPPGLINHGNTCFMNSVLQGLIATRLLSDLVLFAPIPQEMQTSASTPIVSRRSPQLTNGHNLAGAYEQPWINSMPIGDMFLTVMYKAWDSQAARRKDVLSPKPILSALGKKYDQYLDFAQQDAHEFLRILLDAMRMEEQDIIKKRQPPSPSKKRRRTTITPEGLHALAADPTAPSELPLLSFADMIFGGELTSILVCQKCKHVSQTYEEFNDISLSIKAEDYLQQNRKRDRFKKIVGKLTQFPGAGKSPTRHPITHTHAVELLRASSVPPSPSAEREAAQVSGRRSLDVPTAGADSEPNTPPAAAETVPEPPTEVEPALERQTVDEEALSDSSNVDEKHVDFLEPTVRKERHDSASVVAVTDKERAPKDDMGWAKLGRRISLSVGLGRSRGSDKDKDKDKKDRDRKSRSMDRSNLGVPKPIVEDSVEDLDVFQSVSTSGTPGTSTSVDDSTVTPKNRPVPDGTPSNLIVNGSEPAPTSNVPTSSSSANKIPLRAPPSSIPVYQTTSLPAASTQPHSSHAHAQSLGAHLFHGVQRSKSPKPPKPTVAQTEYLRKILADISTAPTLGNPFSLFKPPTLPYSTAHSASAPVGDKEKGAVWLGMGRNFSGIEECLRLFTAVEVLDGDNMVGCRQCWKVQNGQMRRGKDSDADDDDEDGEATSLSKEESVHPPTPELNLESTSSMNGTVEQHVPENARPPLKLLSPTSNGHIPTSLSTPTVSTYSIADDASDTRSVSSLPSEPTSLLVDEGSDSSASLSITVESDSSSPSTSLSGPGGMPIPSISTTAPPDTPTALTTSIPPYPLVAGNESGGGTTSLNAHSRQGMPIYGSNANSLSKDSLSIPSRSRRRPLYSDTTTTDNDSSDEESDTSVDTTVSAESSVSRRGRVEGQMGASTEGGSAPSTSVEQAPPATAQATKKSSKPKPVVMRPAYKRYLISTPPPVLVIHLKRFQQTTKSPFMSFSHGFKKLDDYISFPEYLDLLPFLAPRKEDYGLGKKKSQKGGRNRAKEERCMYRLYAVVVHIGNMLGGHYVAYTALPTDPPPMTANTSTGNAPDSAHPVPPLATASDSTSGGSTKAPATEHAPAKPKERQWAHISDTAVRLTTLEEVLRAKAYICMYERC